MPHDLLRPLLRQAHVPQPSPHLQRRLPRQPLAYPAHRDRAGVRARREPRRDLRAARVVDRGARGRLRGVRARAEELDVAAVARDERVPGDEDVVRVVSAPEALPAIRNNKRISQPGMVSAMMIGRQRLTHISLNRSLNSCT